MALMIAALTMMHISVASNEIRTKKEERLKELEATLVMLEEQDEDVEVNASYLLELAHRLPELFKSSRTELKTRF